MTDLETAIKAIKAGAKQTGGELLVKILKNEPDNDTAWLWLAAAVDDPAKKKQALQKAISLNPNNETAQKALDRLTKMNQPPEPPPIEMVIESRPYLTWDEIWLRAISKPSIATFENILNSARATTNRAYLWIAISSLVGLSILVTGSILFNLLSGKNITGFSAPFSTMNAGLIVMLFIFTPIVGLFAHIIVVAAIQWVATSLFGAAGNFNQFVFIRATYVAPAIIINSALSIIPAIKYLSFLFSIYILIIDLIAIRAVNKFGWVPAIASLLIPTLVILLPFCFCLSLVAFSRIG